MCIIIRKGWLEVDKLNRKDTQDFGFSLPAAPPHPVLLPPLLVTTVPADGHTPLC